jgi:hypothetical protein
MPIRGTHNVQPSIASKSWLRRLHRSFGTTNKKGKPEIEAIGKYLNQKNNMPPKNLRHIVGEAVVFGK